MHFSSLQNLIGALQNRNVTIIESNCTAPKRASVGILLRIKNNSLSLDVLSQTQDQNINLEILYIRRSFNPKDRWSCHMAFPGGKAEVNESDKDSCEREWREEIGIDLKKNGIMYLGRLDDREVKAAASWCCVRLCISK
jgi:8-oxo-dGTP pyrophosphatase MutT (NUDIX family)